MNALSPAKLDLEKNPQQVEPTTATIPETRKHSERKHLVTASFRKSFCSIRQELLEKVRIDSARSAFSA
eukprot:1219795-Amphidinium_carterae.1